ncbi:MAG: bifunctional helix-turn-helix transcriptional regulator/GNAT family N-acetyltransferase [Flavobacteriaceae bacterium]|nr:bifunctional helix-turn-helix transcriptional regulator/GNAT family N-acetyltransferase [Flavobacteriaceae bacterium]
MERDFIEENGVHGLTARLKRIVEKLTHSSRDFYKEVGVAIEPNWYLVFRLLQEKKQCTIGELSAVLQFAHPTVIAMIKKMEQSGFVERLEDPNDSRRKPICLTYRGKSLLPKLERYWQAGSKALEEIFPDYDSFSIMLEGIEKRIKQEDFKHRTWKAYRNMQNHEVPINLQYEIHIQPFKIEYASAFAKLNLEWLDHYFEIEPIDREVLSHPKNYILNKGGFIFFAIYKEEAVGTVALMPTKLDGMELTKMAVSPRYRGLKIGRKLMDTCIKHAQSMGWRSLVLYSNTKLESAIRLYKKVGFKEIPLPKDNPYIRSNIKMRLDL